MEDKKNYQVNPPLWNIRQYCFMENKKNYQVNPPLWNIMCIIKHVWLLWGKSSLYWHPNFL